MPAAEGWGAAQMGRFPLIALADEPAAARVGAAVASKDAPARHKVKLGLQGMGKGRLEETRARLHGGLSKGHRREERAKADSPAAAGGKVEHPASMRKWDRPGAPPRSLRPAP